MKNYKQLERHFKGVSNHYRIAIVLLLAKNKMMILEDIVDSLGGNVKTISSHTRRLVVAGLVNKRYYKRNVIHSLSPYGRKFATFIKNFQKF